MVASRRTASRECRLKEGMVASRRTASRECRLKEGMVASRRTASRECRHQELMVVSREWAAILAVNLRLTAVVEVCLRVRECRLQDSSRASGLRAATDNSSPAATASKQVATELLLPARLLPFLLRSF
jgi:hypothetical protein